MFNFVFLSVKRWFQFNFRIVRTHFATMMTLYYWKMIAETRSYIFRWRSCFRRRLVCVNSLFITKIAFPRAYFESTRKTGSSPIKIRRDGNMKIHCSKYDPSFCIITLFPIFWPDYTSTTCFLRVSLSLNNHPIAGSAVKRLLAWFPDKPVVGLRCLSYSIGCAARDHLPQSQRINWHERIKT